MCRVGCANLLLLQLRIPAPHAAISRGTTRMPRAETAKDKTKDPNGRIRVESLPLGLLPRRCLANSEPKGERATTPACRTRPERCIALVRAISPAGPHRGFGQPPGQRLHSYLYLQIAWKRAARRRFNKYVKGPAPHIRMRPKRNYTRPNFLVLNNRKRRTIVCVRWSRQHQQERKPKPARKFSRTYEPTKHCLNQASTPPKS